MNGLTESINLYSIRYMKKVRKIFLEDNNNIHFVKFKLTFKPNEDEDDDDDDGYDDTYFPDESDVEYALENSMLDQANEYIVYVHKITDKKAVFMIEVTNEETDEYIPSEEDIENAMEYSGDIDEWNMFYAEIVSETINRTKLRDEKLTEIGL